MERRWRATTTRPPNRKRRVHVDKILPPPWGLLGAAWRLAPSHQLIGALYSPAVTSVCAPNTGFLIFVHGGVGPGRGCAPFWARSPRKGLPRKGRGQGSGEIFVYIFCDGGRRQGRKTEDKPSSVKRKRGQKKNGKVRNACATCSRESGYMQEGARGACWLMVCGRFLWLAASCGARELEPRTTAHGPYTAQRAGGATRRSCSVLAMHSAQACFITYKLYKP
jgi:hypothetical protein